MTRRHLLLFAVLLCAACGGSDRHLPLAVGATWVYRVTDENNAVHEKKNVVEAEEDVGGRFAGTRAFRVRMETTDGVNLSWQKDTGGAVVRLRDKTYDKKGALILDESYDPYKLRVDDSKAAAGTTWTEKYAELTTDVTSGDTKRLDREDRWTVEATGETIASPAGTFRCLRLHRVSLETSSKKRYWFAPGVGKIREESNQIEELVRYTLP